jgi:hypothetical protein
MSIRAARWILWLACMGLLPLPFFLAETGLVPPARMFMLGCITLAVLLVEGSLGVVQMSAALCLVQAAGYGGLLWIIATVAARMLRRLSPAVIRRVTLALVLVGVAWAATFAIYRDPFRAHRLHTTLLHVYE